MGKRLVITEKPSVARDICAALGNFSQGNEYFENDDLVVTWAVGHLLGLAPPEEYDKAYKQWTLKTLPILPESFRIVPREGQKKRLSQIKKLGSRDDVDSLINACDAGREGEIIFRRIIEYTGLNSKPHERLWLQSMTRAAIIKGFTALRPGSELATLGDAAWLRGVGDWLIGMNATRALTRRLKGRREKGVWSAGRVQTPTLNLLVEREREILAHESRPYWEMVATIGGADQVWEGRYWDRGQQGAGDREVKADRLFDRARVDTILAALKGGGAGIASETRKQSRQRAPLPFDLTSLQREANRRFSFTAKRTLKAAQRLYEGHKALTYPRTDSRYLPEDYQASVDEVLESLCTDAEFSKVATKVAANPQNLDKLLDSSKVTDHFAIVPTSNTPGGDLSSDDRKIYTLVVSQFLASMMGPATWARVERLVDVTLAEGDVVTFRTTAKSLEVPGFLEALGKAAGSGTTLPALIPGNDNASDVPCRVEAISDEEKVTKPPGRYTEAALLRAMEAAGEQIEDEDLSEVMRGRGIGTPATRADIIEGLITKQYARRVDSRIGTSPKGMRLMDILERADVPTLASPRLTGELEHELRQVQEGSVSRNDMLDNLVKYTREVTDCLVTFDHDELYAKDPDIGGCPACEVGKVVENPWGYRCSRNTAADSECSLMIWKDRGGRYIDLKIVQKLLADRKVGPISGFVGKDGRETEGTLFLELDPDKGKWGLRTEYSSFGLEDTEEEAGGVLCPCPEHENCEIVETNLRYVCRLVLEGKTRVGPVLPRVVCHRSMEPEEILPFFQAVGKTETFTGFISKRGRGFPGLLFRKPTGKHGFEFPPRESKGKKKKSAAKKAKPKAKTTRGKKTARRTKKKDDETKA